MIGDKDGGGPSVAVVRRSPAVAVELIHEKKADEVTATLTRVLMPLNNSRLTIALDNGKEFVGHTSIAATLQAEIHFAHPYSALERGLNENGIGLLWHYPRREMRLPTQAPCMQHAVGA